MLVRSGCETAKSKVRVRQGQLWDMHIRPLRKYLSPTQSLYARTLLELQTTVLTGMCGHGYLGYSVTCCQFGLTGRR
jgi:hypothetical protein